MSNFTFDKIKDVAKRSTIITELYRFLRDFSHSVVTGIIRVFYWLLLSNRYFRKFSFDAAPKNTLLVTNGHSEHFIVTSSDKIIGRKIYTVGQFDFDKLVQCTEILGIESNDFCLFDIGANIGSVCIPAVNGGYFKCAVAVEPEPFNFNLLMANIYLNHLSDRIETHNLALGAQDGQELTFELSETNFGDHRVKFSDDDGSYGETGRKIIHVRSERFDRVFDSVDARKSLIWMDTQGSEGYILAGATKAISQRVPLVIEFWPYGMLRSGAYDALKQSLFQGGYEVFYDLSRDIEATPLSEESLGALWQRLGEKGNVSGNVTDLLII